MKKDAFLAVLIGFAIGLTITALIIVTPMLAKGLPKFQLPKFPNFSFKLPILGKKTTSTGSTSPTPTATVNQKFAIDSPLAEAIETSDQLLVSGTAKPQSTIVAQTTSDDVVTTANDQGMWAIKVTLTEGKNDILVTSYTTGEQLIAETQTVTVFYTPEE